MSSRIRRLRSSCRGPSATPNTAEAITSSVSACIDGSSVKSRSTGHESIARSAASRIVCSYARMRSPWNGGSSSLRWRMCSAPSSNSTDRAPTTGPSTALASPARSCVGGARNTCFTSSGWKTMTKPESKMLRKVTMSP